MDERVERGLRTHFEGLGTDFESGEQRLGYKVAFNVPAAQERMGIPSSLIAGLTRSTLVSSGDGVPVGKMKTPLLEAEVAVRLRADVAGTEAAKDVVDAIDAIAPAIELVDMNLPLDQLENILAQGVFHRAVAFGEFKAPPTGAALGGLAVQVTSNGSCVFECDAESATGLLTYVVLHVARTARACGQQLRAGDHVILGSMAPPIAAAPKGHFSVSLAGYGDVELSFRRSGRQPRQ